MITKVDDLGLTSDQSDEEVDQILKDKLGINLTDMAEILCKDLQEKAEEVAKDFFTVVPFEDYSKLIEGDEKITKFFRELASKPENWIPVGLWKERLADESEILSFAFSNKAVEDLLGYIWVNFSGKVIHHFVQGDP